MQEAEAVKMIWNFAVVGIFLFSGDAVEKWSTKW
jgi:hypothetical protein